MSAACSEDSSKPDDSLESGGDLWMLQTKVYMAEEYTGYAIPTNELDGDISTDNAIEQVGGGWLFSQPGKPNQNFLLTQGERGAATRYRVGDDNEFVKGKTVSFENYGVKSGYGIVAWVDEHLAYWFDSEQMQAIRFDPTDMVIEEATQIEGLQREGYSAWFSDRPVVREDGVFITVNWSQDWAEVDAPDSPKGSTLVHIDAASGDITVTEDERCTSLLASMTTPDGDSYFFSNYENAYVRIVTDGKTGVPDCALRVRKGATKFDPEWSLNITERTGGRPADGVLPGDGNTMWLRVFHEDKVAEPLAEFDDVDSAAAWQWYKLDLDSDEPAEANSDRPYSSHGTAGVVTQGRSFFMEPNEDYSESALLELVDDEFQKRATVVGELNTLIQVR